jgi:uncharacterized protein YndB with AHSA1/START domain
MKSDIKLKESIKIDATVSDVWDALTNPEQIRKYFFGTNTKTDWKAGSPIRFEGEWEGKTYQDKGTVREVIENKRIRYDYWSSMSGIEDKPENYVMVTYDISGTDNDVTLTVTQENIPDEKMKEHSSKNWRMVLESLKDLVENQVARFA